MFYSPSKMKQLLEKYGFNFKKNFGQNFIIDENIITNIIEKSGVDKDTLVIEIGPGAGSLTYKLTEYAKNVVCYEIDTKLKPILDEVLKDCNNVEVFYEDFLKCDILKTIKKYNYKKIYVIANLPYYITTPIIVKLIEDKIQLEKIVVMVQKEVGNRFKAEPGTKEYSSLSVFLNFYFDIRKLIDVSSNVFMPKPNVDSIVVEFVKHNKYNNVLNEEFFFKLVRDSFKQKRKTLRNNLKEYDLNIISNVLLKSGKDLSVRAEKLTIEEFIEMSNALCKEK